VKTCEYAGEPFTEPRTHPWSDSAANAAYRYLDLRADPALIRTALEDLVPWSHYAAIDRLYGLLEWLNASASDLESSDCAFSGPYANEVASIPKHLECSGRIIVLFRDLARNLARPELEALKDRLHHRLAALDPQLAWGMIGTTLVPVRYVTLAAAADQQRGHQLMISFWAWGDSELEAMANLDRVIRNLARALRAPR
jgi:hypothetical protein